MAPQLRSLFVTILVHCGYSQPATLYTEFQDAMAVDFLRSERMQADRDMDRDSDIAPNSDSDGDGDSEIRADLAWRAERDRVSDPVHAGPSRPLSTVRTSPSNSQSGASVESLRDDADITDQHNSGSSEVSHDSDQSFINDGDDSADVSDRDSLASASSGSARGTSSNSSSSLSDSSVHIIPAWKKRAYIHLRLALQTVFRSHGYEMDYFKIPSPTEAEIASLSPGDRPLRHSNPLIE